MIVGTAGHIDHGKTSLVHALTGVHTDRLPEEKRRGISIELGYAYLDVPGGGRVGFVDVPGHERLVHTMLAGATGVDCAMLVVAADDGVMPQTREHLAVLSLLGIRRGITAVTKTDRADDARRTALADELAAALRGTPLEQSPRHWTSIHTHEGIDALRDEIFRMASDTPQHLPADEGFRLAVDRCFTLGGIGTVVTGAVHRGRVRVGDALRVVPGELTARVRSIHTNDRASDEAQAGQRCALALAGVSKDDVPRGSWVVEPSIALATQRVDVRLRLWRGEVQPLKSGAQVHVHAGTAAATGTVALLDMPALAPGEACLAQLVLHRPLALWRGDRIVLRDASASRTLAGAEVLDPFAPTRYRQTPQRLRELAALEQGAAAALLAASAHGVDWQRLRIAWGLPAAPPVPAEALEAGDWVLAPTQAGAASALALQALTGFHAAHPDEPGPDAKRLRRLTVPRLPEPLWQALLQRLIASGRVAQRGACLHLPAHEARLNATELRIGQKAMPQLQRAGFEGAWVRDLGAAIGEPEPLVRAALAALARRGELHQVVRDLYYTPEALAAMAQIARGLAAADAHQGLSAAQFRDATGLGRKRAIQVLEYFDRVGLLRRAGEQHRLRVDCELFRDAR